MPPPRNRRFPLPIFLLLCAFVPAAHAAGTVFSTILSGIGQEYPNAVTSDAQGNTYVAGVTYSNDFPVTAGAYQTTFGGTCDAFVTKLGPDGKVIWSTFLGGVLSDSATGIALDGSGNVWVTGWTVSPGFPVVNPIPGTGINGYAAFVSKFDPTGSKLLFSSFLSGQSGAGIAVDSTGNAYVAVNASGGANGIAVEKLSAHGTLTYSYFYTNGVASAIALDSTGAVYVAGSSPGASFSPALQTFGTPPSQLAIAFKLSPDGSTKLYDKTFGGSTMAYANAIAVDSAGEAWVAGTTASADFPLVHPLQTTLGARPLFQSADGGVTWTPLDNLPFALPRMLAVDPTTPTTLYEATSDLGIFKSTNGGATWTQSNNGIASTNAQAITVDPVHPLILYAATTSTLYKSTDGANTWSAIDTPGYPATQISVDGQNTNVVYTVCTNTEFGYTNYFRKSTDGGVTWNNVTFPQTTGIAALALDPRVSGHVFAISNEVLGPNIANSFSYLYRSVDAGVTWTQVQEVAQPTLPGPALVADPSTDPTTLYDGLALRSLDGGLTWSAFPSLPSAMGSGPIAVDSSGTLFAAVDTGFYVSHDHGQTWSQVATSDPVGFYLYTAGSAGTLYGVANEVGTAGFVSKLSADGSTLAYSTYLRGHASGKFGLFYAAESSDFELENWIAGIALDPAGNVVVTGGTRAVDFPTVNPAQAANAGLADAFAATISADGGTLMNSTYFGGSQDDGALAAAIDSTGNVILAGQTWSGDFPVPGGSQLPFTYGDAFVVKLATGAPVIGSVLNGASFLPGIEAGSWVMIKGVNLANTTRIWGSADFNGNNLPVSLSGVSVTIDGLPAFPYYISPTQINVQAPSGNTLGAVNVVVDNNGTVSALATVPLQSFAPAFFMDPGTNYAIASRLPNYALVGTPSAPANPGDTLVLWATGFGPTTPTVPAGVEVSGAPATLSLPVVTVGGMQVTVISSVLTPGSAGVYQIAIQLPANVPTGNVTVQASIGGAETPGGITLFIG